MTGGWGYFGSKWTVTLRHTHLPETGAEVTHNEECVCSAFKLMQDPAQIKISSGGSGKFFLG